MKEYVGIYIKTEKAQEQDGFGNKMKYHFHITLHKYSLALPAHPTLNEAGRV